MNQLQVDGQTVTGNENIANEFNKFFCEIGPKLAEKIQQIMLITYNTLLHRTQGFIRIKGFKTFVRVELVFLQR